MMKKPKIVMQIIKEETGFSAICHVNTDLIGTQGVSFEDLKNNILDAINLYAGDKGFTYEFEEIALKPDVPSFFEFYKVINAKALAERVGIEENLLTEYMNGHKKPTPVQTKRILKGVQQVGKELSAIQFFL